MSEVSGIAIEAAIRSAISKQVCEALVGCEFVPHESEKAFPILSVLECEPHDLVLDRGGVEQTVKITRGNIEASDELLGLLSAADRPSVHDLELLLSKGLGDNWCRADGTKLADALRRPAVPRSRERRTILELISDPQLLEGRRTLLAHWVEQTPIQGRLEPELASDYAKCLRDLRDPSAAILVIDRALRWDMPEINRTILHTQRAASILDVLELQLGDQIELERSLSHSIELIKPLEASSDKVRNLLRRFDRITCQGARSIDVEST
ncbi:hypothetical protein K3181_12065 [Qipengyuania sp. YG27]|uniref:DUF2336 domain-containing protein n=1 Tax=Qipengyuania mesophila TaxID=2867246 RepID=A0ABS7JWZ2_9SPHN|nr:hypothetical protein [Qipengyuania mesophila]MBX7502178.1 hypothetical protein [Qipengyuania mesophila]